MRVLLINPHIFSGGVEKVVVSTARWLNKLGVKCDILTLSVEPETIKEEGMRFLLPAKETQYTPNVAIHTTTKKLLLELQSLYLSTNSVINDYDIFNPNSFPAYWVFGLVKTPNQAKVVWTCHDVFGVYGSMRTAFERNKALHVLEKALATFDRHVVSKNVDAIVTVSTLHAEEVMLTYGQRPYIIPPAIEIENYVGGNDKVFREKYSISHSFLALHVGNMIPRKGQEISIRAIAILRDIIPNACLALIGSGPDMQRLRRLVLDLNLKENVIFTGKISDENLKNAYKAADVNLLPSTLESFGLTPLEALASGTVSIVSKETGLSEYLRLYEMGYVLDARTPSELAKMILHVYKNPDEAKTKVKKAQDILREKFSWNDYVQKLLEVYKTVG